MANNKKNLNTLLFKVTILFYLITLIVLSLFFKKELIIAQYVNILTYIFPISFLIVDLTEKYFWKPIINLSSKSKILSHFLSEYETPILQENYNVVIKHNLHNSQPYEIRGKMKIKQTYTTVTISMTTENNRSHSLISEIIKENDKYVLYYIYETNPKALELEGNPAQKGGCRIYLNSTLEGHLNNDIEGDYWTSSKTIGEIYLKSI